MRRQALLALSFSIASLSVASFATTAHAEPPRITIEPPKFEVRAQTPANPAKIPEFHVDKRVGEIPTVAPQTVRLAHEHDLVTAVGGDRPIPARLRDAKIEVLQRNNTVEAKRVDLKNQIGVLETRANSLEHPMAQQYVRGVGATLVEQEPTVDGLRQASEGFVAAAQLGRVKGANFEHRLGEAQPDMNTRPAHAEDFEMAAKLYERSAVVLDKLAVKLEAAGDNVGAQQARDKARNTRFTAHQDSNAARDLRKPAEVR